MALLSMNGALLLLVALLLSLRLLSLGTRRRWGGSARGWPGTTRSVSHLACVAVLLTTAFALSGTPASKKDALISELEHLRLKCAGLEVLLEESTKTLRYKELYLEEKNKLIEEMKGKIQFLEDALKEVKATDVMNIDDRLHGLEKEVLLLSEQSLRNKIAIQSLELSADEKMKNMEVATAEVEKMESIIAEQWTQIQQLEQAFVLIKMMTSKVLKRSKEYQLNNIWPIDLTIKRVVQFLRAIGRAPPSDHKSPDAFFLSGSLSTSGINRLYDHLKVLMSFAKKCHYELQGIIGHTMQMNEFTAVFANNWVTIFLIVDGIITLLNITADPATFIQGGIPSILEKSKDDFFQKTIGIPKKTADMCYDKLNEVDCISCLSKPEGSMFVMVKLNFSYLEDIHDDFDFCYKLAKEESIIILPGEENLLLEKNSGVDQLAPFDFAADPSSLEGGLDRLKSFCLRHAKENKGLVTTTL